MHLRRTGSRLAWSSWFAALCLLGCGVHTQAATISLELQRAVLHRGSHADTALLLRFTDALDLQPYAIGDRSLRDNRLLLALQARAARNRAAVQPLLLELGAEHIRDLWLINAVAVTVASHAVARLAQHPGVARLDLDSLVQGGRSQRLPLSRSAAGAPAPAGPQASPPAPAQSVATSLAQASVPVEWPVQALQVPALWALGLKGRGITVATLDTGVDLAHPDLRGQWRGGRNSWFDPHGEEATPYDALGHGTQALGVLLGAGGTGVAPEAQWIAARLYNGDGRASMSDIHLAFQWLLDPDGDPSTLDAPDVVNASWSLSGSATGTCVLEFAEDLAALRSAGIAVVFAAGNDGPRVGTSNSPGNNPGVLSVGAADSEQHIARATSRGPSACDAATFPRLLAPGVGIRTTDLSHGGLASYTTVSGSSLAAPHASGVLALLAGAFPRASVAELEAALLGSAQNAGAGEAVGAQPGHIRALAAYQALQEAQTNQQQGVAKP
jgi:subtilisin family serine protease